MNGIACQRGGSLSLLVGCLLVSISSLVGCRCVQCNEEAVVVEHQVHSPVNVLVSKHYARLRPRRVVIATPISRASLLPEQKTFAFALANSLRRSGFADTVVGRQCACDVNAVRKGQVDLRQLVDLSNEYSADAVLYCDVVSFSSYAPLEVSVSLTLVDARESVALIAVDGSWDLREPHIRASYQRYLSGYGSESDFKNGIRYQSPTEFLKFVSLELADFMRLQQ